MRTTSKFAAASLVAAICCMAACTAKPAQQLSPPKAGPRKPLALRSIAESDGWNAQDFFDDKTQLALCEAISSHDLEAIRLLAKDKELINRGGKYGFTVLHWAFVREDRAAFELLLKEGADPDRVLTQHIDGKQFNVFYANESVLFTSLRCMRASFCMMALPYSKNPNKLVGKDNLLHVFFQTSAVCSKSELKQLIDQNVDINKVGSFGYTPCHLAALTNPDLCISLIEAGADPGIEDEQGKDVYATLQAQRKLLKNSGKDTAAYDRTIDWFNANRNN